MQPLSTTNNNLVANKTMVINCKVDFWTQNQNFTFISIAARQYHDIKYVNMNACIWASGMSSWKIVRYSICLPTKLIFFSFIQYGAMLTYKSMFTLAYLKSSATNTQESPMKTLFVWQFTVKKFWLRFHFSLAYF